MKKNSITNDPQELLLIISTTDPTYCSDEEFDTYSKAMDKFKKLPKDVLETLDIPDVEQEKLEWKDRVFEFRKIYRTAHPEKPIVVACSFGKDSTTVVRLVCDGLTGMDQNELTRKVYVVTSDTKAENPQIKAYVYDQVEKLNKWANENNMPVEAHVVVRPVEDGIYACLIGRGYTLPSVSSTKWCTQKLKIQPQNKFIQQISPAFLLVGTRTDESTTRKRTINKYRFNQGRVGYSPYNKGIRIYTSIVDMTTEDVWNILQAPLQWSSSLPVRNLYAKATGECGLTNPNGAKEFSNACSARFGCYMCPVVLNDKSTENMSEHDPWMLPLTVWRKYLISEWTNPENHSGYRRKGQPSGKHKGCITIPTRRKALAYFLEIEKEYNELRAEYGLPYDQLLEQDEYNFIIKQLDDDEKNRPWLMDNTEYREGDFGIAREELLQKRLNKLGLTLTEDEFDYLIELELEEEYKKIDKYLKDKVKEMKNKEKESKEEINPILA